MFHKHQTEQFAVDAADHASTAAAPVDHWNPALIRARAEHARSEQVREMIGQFGRYLSALALSRGRKRG